MDRLGLSKFTHFLLLAMGLATVSPASVANAACPAEFTEVENQGISLGCIQISEEAPVGRTWIEATRLCSTEHGGRLPTVAEWVIARDSVALSDITPSLEWNSDLTAETVGMASQLSPSGTVVFNTMNINNSNVETRCWVPSHSLFQAKLVPALPAIGSLVLGIGLIAAGVTYRRRLASTRQADLAITAKDLGAWRSP